VNGFGFGDLDHTVKRSVENNFFQKTAVRLSLCDGEELIWSVKFGDPMLQNFLTKCVMIFDFL